MGNLKKSNKKNSVKLNGVVNPNKKGHGDDPFFIKKANEARELLKRYPIPEEILKRTQSND